MDRVLLAWEIVKEFGKNKQDGKTNVGKLVNSAVAVLQDALDQQPPEPPITQPVPVTPA